MEEKSGWQGYRELIKEINSQIDTTKVKISENDDGDYLYNPKSNDKTYLLYLDIETEVPGMHVYRHTVPDDDKDDFNTFQLEFYFAENLWYCELLHINRATTAALAAKIVDYINKQEVIN